MIQQVAFKLKPQSCGFHLITDEVLRNLPELPKAGLLNLFVQHTSCALSICENWDPSVREDWPQCDDWRHESSHAGCCALYHCGRPAG